MRENSSRNQDGLKYQKLYNWGRTLIMSGVLRNMDKFPSEHMLQNKFGYSRQTVRNALDRLEQDGLIARVKGSGTYVSYAPEKDKEERPRIGLILSYFSDYLFPQVYEGIESVLREEGYEISVSVTRNRLNDEALYLKGMLGRNVSGLIIEGTRSSFPNPNLRLYKEIRRRNIPTLFIHNHYQNETFDSVEMSDARAGYELTRILIQNGHTRIGGYGREIKQKRTPADVPPDEGLYRDDPLQRRGGRQLYGFFKGSRAACAGRYFPGIV